MVLLRHEGLQDGGAKRKVADERAQRVGHQIVEIANTRQHKISKYNKPHMNKRYYKIPQKREEDENDKKREEQSEEVIAKRRRDGLLDKGELLLLPLLVLVVLVLRCQVEVLLT